MKEETSIDQREQRVKGTQTTAGNTTGPMLSGQFTGPVSVHYNSPSDSDPLIPRDSGKMIDAHGDLALIDKLREWKEVHHRSHSLLDKFPILDVELIICQRSPKDLESGLYRTEQNWKLCVTDFRIMAEIFGDFKNIGEEKTIVKFLEQSNKISEVSQEIGNAKSSDDAKQIQVSVVNIKNDIMALLHVADYQIMKLIDILK